MLIIGCQPVLSTVQATCYFELRPKFLPHALFLCVCVGEKEQERENSLANFWI